MTAVDVDALDAARAAALREAIADLATDLASGRWDAQVSAAYLHADAVLALPEFTELLAEVRRGRALREAVDGLCWQMDAWREGDAFAETPADVTQMWSASLRAALAATDGTP